MPAHVAALYRYPVKGLTREACTAVHVLPGGRIAGDRVLGLRYHDVPTPDDAWGSKVDFVALLNTPGLARLRQSFDPATLHLRIEADDDVLFDGVVDEPGRVRLAAAVARYVQQLDVSALAARASALPLRVVGDGVTARYQDREPGYTTLHGRKSVAAVAAAVDEAPEVTEQRFRSNIAIDGVAAWQEQDWVGRSVRIGEVDFEVAQPVARCLATHAHPVTGVRDIPMMQKLLGLRPTPRPTFAVLLTSARGGAIRVGDAVTPG